MKENSVTLAGDKEQVKRDSVQINGSTEKSNG